MRILLIGHRHPWRMEAAVEREMRRAGHETLLFDDRRSKRLFGRRVTQHLALRAARRFRPDFVFLSKCLALDLETVAEIVHGRPNAMWYHDPQWYADTCRPDVAHIAAVGKLSDVFFVTGFEQEWRSLGLPAQFLPAAGCRDIRPGRRAARFASDVSFIGSGYDAARADFLRALTHHVDVRVFGPGWEEWRSELNWNGGTVEGAEFASVCASASIVLGVNPARAAGATTYASDRMWMVILGGGFYMGARTPGMDRMLLDGVHCGWYSNLDECVALSRRYLADPVERERVRAAGEAFVRAHHTYDRRIGNLLSGEPFTNPLA
jgi:hypothetical protein